jgi:hypothetical protein
MTGAPFSLLSSLPRGCVGGKGAVQEPKLHRPLGSLHCLPGGLCILDSVQTLCILDSE